jgi:hypothetical protein
VGQWVRNAYGVALGSPDGGAPDLYAFQSFAGPSGSVGGGSVVGGSGVGSGSGAARAALPPASLGCGPESGSSRATRRGGLVVCVELLGHGPPPSPPQGGRKEAGLLENYAGAAAAPDAAPAMDEDVAGLRGGKRAPSGECSGQVADEESAKRLRVE